MVAYVEPAIRTSTYQGRETGNDTSVASRCFVEFTYQSLKSQPTSRRTCHEVGVRAKKKHEKTSRKKKKRRRKKKWKKTKKETKEKEKKEEKVTVAETKKEET